MWSVKRTTELETYRSGHNGHDSKDSIPKVRTSANFSDCTRDPPGSNFHNFISFLRVVLLFSKTGYTLRYTESCPSGRRCSTRNAVDRKVSRVRIPNSPPKTQSYQGFCPYDWAFLFSQGHIGVHDFRQELRCASRSALCPAESGYCPLHLPR